MTSQEMMKATAKPGYWWRNIAAIDEQPNWVEEVAPHQTEPGLLFGYPEKGFLAKQYK